MKPVIVISFLILFVVNTRLVCAQDGNILPGISSLSDSNIKDSAIAFVNMTTSPGLEGAVIYVDNDERESTQWRSSLGFNAEFTLRDYIFNGFWGLALAGGRLEDKINLVADDGQRVQLDLTREVVALRGSFGLSFPINQHFKLRPYLSLVASDLQSDFKIDSQYAANNNLPRDRFPNSAQMWSTVGSLEALYQHWYGSHQLELSGLYHLIYTESFSEDNPFLDTDDWNDSIQVKSRFSGPTNLSSGGRPWRWNVYANYSNFLSHNKKSLGYQSLIEVGTGMDWQLNVKPLDWFGWQYVGVKAGLIFGDSVEGYSIGLTAR